MSMVPSATTITTSHHSRNRDTATTQTTATRSLTFAHNILVPPL
jgi:hypothetical protein